MLSDLRVLDLTDERGFLAGKILADLGADVIKVEPPGGDSARDRGPFLGDASRESSLPWLALNTSKRGITLALDSERGRELFLSLVRSCDVVLESFAPGTLDAWQIGFEVLSKARPGVIVCAITPFGQSGPYADYHAHDLVVVAMGGNAFLTGDPERPPVRCSMPTSYYHAAPTAVLGILTALHALETNRHEGSGQFVDVSMRECQLATLMGGAGPVCAQWTSGESTGRTPRPDSRDLGGEGWLYHLRIARWTDPHSQSDRDGGAHARARLRARLAGRVRLGPLQPDHSG